MGQRALDRLRYACRRGSGERAGEEIKIHPELGHGRGACRVRYCVPSVDTSTFVLHDRLGLALGDLLRAVSLERVAA